MRFSRLRHIARSLYERIEIQTAPRAATGHRGSIYLDVGCPDHLAPLLGFVNDELAKIGRRIQKHRDTELLNPCLHFWIGEGSIDLLVERVNDLDWRISGRANAAPTGPFVTRHKFANGR